MPYLIVICTFYDTLARLLFSWVPKLWKNFNLKNLFMVSVTLAYSFVYHFGLHHSAVLLYLVLMTELFLRTLLENDNALFEATT